MPAAFALGLGQARLESRLGQPLRVVVPLHAASSAERSQIAVSIPPAKTFEHFGVHRAAVVDSIRVQLILGRNGAPMRAVLSTSQPVSEPFLRLLLQVNSGRGKAIRQYTLLLDPPPPLHRTTQRPISASIGRAYNRPAATTPQPPTNQYGPVARGETLYSIARKLRRNPSHTISQVAVALYRANPEAFRGNLNRLQSGAVLSVPQARAVDAMDPRAATQTVARQKDAYQQWRSAPPDAGRVEQTPPVHRNRLQPGGLEVADNASQALSSTSKPVQETNPATATARESSGQGGVPSTGSADGNSRPTGQQTSGRGGGAQQTTHSSLPPAGSDSVVTPQSGTAGRQSGASPKQALALVATSGVAQTEQKGSSTNTRNAPAKSMGTQDATANAGNVTSGEPIGSAEPVVAVTADTLFSPRRLFLFVMFVILVGAVVIWLRRRQYKPMLMDMQPAAETTVPPDDDSDRQQAAHDKPTVASGNADDGEAAETVGAATAFAIAEDEDTAADAPAMDKDSVYAPTKPAETMVSKDADADDNEPPLPEDAQPVQSVLLPDEKPDATAADETPTQDDMQTGGVAAPTPSSRAELDAFDLSQFTLEEAALGQIDTEPAATQSDTSADEPIDSTPAQPHDSANDMAAKLDLARAYLEMGDSAMATPLLEDAKARGDARQQQMAASLLKEIN